MCLVFRKTSNSKHHLQALSHASILPSYLSRAARRESTLRSNRTSLNVPPQAMRVFCVSDLHTDYKENFQWCTNLSEAEYKKDTLIVAGDVSDDIEIIRKTLACLAGKWANVFFVPGNHELWVRRGERDVRDSFGKWKLLESICSELGVHYKPKQIDGVWICPILSWYHGSFDTEPDLPGAADIDNVMVDYAACKWPDNLQNGCDELAQRFDSLNEPTLSNLETVLEMDEDIEGSRPPLITFSHFLPLQALLPEKRMLFQPNLAKAAGSDYVARRIEELRPLAHIFGHTHFLWDTTLGGVRYVQWCLGTPREQRRRSGGDTWLPLLLYDTETGMSEQQHCYWSAFYAENKRDPSNIKPAPWARATPHEFDECD